MRSIDIKASTKKYKVNFYDKINDLIKSFEDENLLYLIDENVYNINKTYFEDKLKYIVPVTEYSKTLDFASEVFDYLIDNNFKTDAHIVVVGGGILQDLGGFIASTFCRGIKYTLVPTTLLAQCDSCIGGKTSINHNSRKNILGTFYPPNEIKITTDFLFTLKKEDLLSGYGELIKFYLLNNEIEHFDSNFANIEKRIAYGLKYKSKIIQIDEFDLKERKLLNFGHTFGHALESTSNYKIPHGSAIIMGMLIANELSFKLGRLNEEKRDYIQNRLLIYIKHIKVEDSWFYFDTLLSLVKSDKKNTGDNINMILIDTDNEYNVVSIEDIDLLETCVKSIHEIIRLHN
tara:strand:+ start:2203 stop:3240 length:1038 start_codon:yes stop_codon:yes gene_type:complete